ncbi:MAG TPA: iron ABC transporter permease, partial [Stellaceae bacterium]|nr:iron ABC transporter permease [Stellaceae bacterium]
TIAADKPVLGRKPALHIDLAAGGLLGITLIAIGAILVLVGVVLWLSFTEGTPGDPVLQYTVAHYRSLFLDPFTYRVLWNTVLFSLTCLATSFALALPMAWLMERTDFPGKPVVFTLMTTALLIPSFAVALGWVFLLHPKIGMVNQALMALFNLSDAPFDISNIGAMGIVEGMNLTPLAFVMTAVVMRSMDPALEEAAAISGAKPWQAVWRVTARVLLPGLLAAGIYIAMIGFAAFDVPAILGLTRRIFTFSTYVFWVLTPSEGAPEYGSVATLSVIMIVVAAVLSWCYRQAQRQAPKYAVVTGKAYRPRIAALGKWRGPAIAFVALYFIVAQLMPLLMLGWASLLPYLQTPSAQALAQVSLRNFLNLPKELLWRAGTNTAILMVVVPTVTLTASVAISWVVLRTRIRGRGLCDFFAFLPLAIPAIVFSVAALLLALFVLRYVAPIYGTLWILILVYAVARLSYGTRMTNSALIQIHKELEESAQVCGAATGGVLARVLVPLLAPSLAYAWIWIALLTYRELTLPVVISTSNNLPFSFLVWGFVQASAYGSASAAALLMLGLMLPVLLVYWLAARRAGMIAPR